MNDEIRAIIAKNLPAEVGATLKETLARAEVDARDLKVARDLVQAMAAAEKEKNAELEKYRAFDERNAKLLEREEKAREDERNLKVLTLMGELKAAERVALKYEEFLALLVKNPRAIEFMSHTQFENQASYYNGSTYVSPSAICKDRKESHESFETKQEGLSENIRPEV